MPIAKRRTPLQAWGLGALLVLSLLGCRREQADPATPPAGPVAAVQAMARALADNDMRAYARLSVPPAQYTQLQQAWADGHSRWPLTELPLHDQLLPMLQALSAEDGARQLQRSFDAQLAGQAGAVRQAARSMGVFGVQYLRHQDTYTPSQQAHYIQVVETLAEWAAHAPLSDRARARASISGLTAAARAAAIDSDDTLQQLGMDGSLARLDPFLGTLKAVLAGYGLDLDESLRAISGEVLSTQGDNALVRLSYPLAGKTITLQIPLTRREGRWYLTRTLADTDALLRHAAKAREASAATALPADAGEDDSAVSTPAKP